MAKHDFSRTKVSWLPQFISLCHVEMAREKKRNSAEKKWLLSFNCRFEKNQADQSLWRFTFPKTQQVRSLSFCGGTSNSSSKSAGLSPELIIGALLSCGSPHGKWKNPLLWKVGGILQTKDGLSCFPQAARQLGDFEDFRCSFWKQKWPMFKGLKTGSFRQMVYQCLLAPDRFDVLFAGKEVSQRHTPPLGKPKNPKTNLCFRLVERKNDGLLRISVGIIATTCRLFLLVPGGSLSTRFMVRMFGEFGTQTSRSLVVLVFKIHQVLLSKIRCWKSWHVSNKSWKWKMDENASFWRFFSPFCKDPFVHFHDYGRKSKRFRMWWPIPFQHFQWPHSHEATGDWRGAAEKYFEVLRPPEKCLPQVFRPGSQRPY